MAKKLCAICNVRVDQSSMEQHLQGKKHISVVTQMKIKIKRDQKACSEGIYVTGNKVFKNVVMIFSFLCFILLLNHVLE